MLFVPVIAVVALVASGSSQPSAAGRPNIVMIAVDDQTAEAQRFLTKTNADLGAHGVTFDNSFVNYPLCCPSRATYFTGQYAHNHRVLGNAPPSGGFTKMAPTLGNTLPVWLQGAGYYTGLVGKFLNHYGKPDPRYIPPGWNQWYATVDNHRVGGTYSLYGYTLNENGKLVHYGTKPRVVDAAYQTDVLSQLSTNFIRSRTPSQQPFFLYIAPRDPHIEPKNCDCGHNNPRGAKRYLKKFPRLKAPRTPAFNEANSGKPKSSDASGRPPLSRKKVAAIDARYRSQIRSLLGVDDMVHNVVQTLKQQGELNNTVILYTSDEGFLHGEHRIAEGKVIPYEPSIRVPLLFRAPGMPQGVHRQQPVVNADLAPTILDLAHANPGRVEDGTSLIPIMRQPQYWPGRGIELEAWDKPTSPTQVDNPPLNYKGVRTDRFAYVRYAAGDQELYDLRKDPFEIHNVASDPAYAAVTAALRNLLGVLENCVGVVCRTPPALTLTVHSCSSAEVTGPGMPQEATFYLQGRQIGRVSTPPIQIPIRGGTNGDTLTAVATSLDGRNLSLTRTLGGC